MKFSPIVIFLFILSALAISIVLIQTMTKPAEPVQKEGFLQYYGTLNDLDTFNRSSTSIKIPYYSTEKTVHKLYDNIYYDPSNGAVIILYGQEISGSEEITGGSISAINIFERNGSDQGKKPVPTSLPTTANYTPLAATTTLISTYKSFTIITNTSANKYELVYIPWGKETYLHLMDLNGRKHIATFAYDSDGNIVKTATMAGNTQTSGVEEVIFNNASITSTYTADPRSHKDDFAAMVITSKYSSKNYLYQLCENVKYDAISGQVVSLITIDSTALKSHEFANFATPNKLAVYKRPKIYDRTPPMIEYRMNSTNTSENKDIPTPTSIDNTDGAVIDGFTAAVFDSIETNFTVLYIATGTRTVLVSLYPSSNTAASDLKIHGVMRFNANGAKDDGSNYSSVGSSFNSQVSGENLNDYLQMLIYLQGTGSGNLYSGAFTNDYMLKTQIVPPVCPTCPSCPSYDGVCSSCGGKGGSGTQGAKGSGSNGDEPGLGRIIYDSGSGTKEILEKTGSGATNLVRDTGKAGLGVAAVGAGLGVAGVQGAVGLGREVVGGTVGLGREVVGGTLDLAREAGRNVSDAVGELKPTRVSSTQFDNLNNDQSSGGSGSSVGGVAGQSRTITAGSDSLSYFGALPPKGGNYIPVTADFSRFGR